MLGFFTDPYPNELLYSAVSRYHHYIGNSLYIDTNYEVYGVRKPISNLYFGVYLDFLSNSLGGSYNTKEIILNHTIFPFYKPFITEELCNKVIHDMKFSNPNFVTLGLLSSRICKKKYLYYCPKCVEEDIKEYGEAYFHAQHQLDGISICLSHRILLKPYLSFKPWENSYEYLKFDCSKADMKMEFPIVDETYKKIIEITKLAYELFSLDTSNINKQKLCKYYKNILYEKGFITIAGYIRRKELKKAMIDYYGVDFLNNMESSIKIESYYNWVDEIFLNNERFFHPIKHLLLINFLGQTISDIIINIDDSYNYFGNGPWPCMNHICNHYKEEIINIVEIKMKNKQKIYGVFKCDVCGFKYTRHYSKENDDKYDVRYVVDKGELWFDTLKKLAESREYSIKEIAVKMNVTDRVIRTYLKELRVGKYEDYNITVRNEKRLNENKVILLNAKKSYTLINIRKVYKNEFLYVKKYDEEWLYTNLSYKKKSYKKGKLEIYKERFLELKNANPDITMTELNHVLSSNVLSYIKKNDPKWWEENAPVSKRGTSHVCGLSDIRVDWPNRDKELLSLLKEKYKEICSREYVIRITRQLFMREISSISISQYSIERMPKSNAFIESVMDSHQSYAIKCYKRYLYDKFENDNNVTINDIPRKFHNFYKQDEFVIKELEEYINTLKRQAEII